MPFAAESAAIRRAAALMLHWGRRDIPAVVASLTEIESLDQAGDVITGLLLLQDADCASLESIVLKAALRETATGK